MNNKKTGNDFEKEFCRRLANAGFWAHNFAQKAAGQPCDVIAARNGRAYIFDCKVTINNVFPLYRIEENQVNAMSLWREKNNGSGWFAFKTPADGIWLARLEDLLHYMGEVKTLDLQEIVRVGFSFEDWLKIA